VKESEGKCGKYSGRLKWARFWGWLGQAAFNPRNVLVFLSMGEDVELDIVEASRFVRPGEAIPYWSLQACSFPPNPAY
jgi:hypothetical protein